MRTGSAATRDGMMVARIAALGIARYLGTVLGAAVLLAAAVDARFDVEARDLPAPGIAASAANSPGVTLTPAEIVELRFPPEWRESAVGPESEIHVPIYLPNFRLSAFAAQPPPALSGLASNGSNAPFADGRPRWFTDAVTTLAVWTEDDKARPPPSHNALFNEAQITAIKRRLKLNRKQERYWPPVAVSLRSIGWKNSGRVRRDGVIQAGTKVIDPNSKEIQRLMAAIGPLIKSLNNDQKSEVRLLMNVMGLGKLASSF